MSAYHQTPEIILSISTIKYHDISVFCLLLLLLPPSLRRFAFTTFLRLRKLFYCQNFSNAVVSKSEIRSRYRRTTMPYVPCSWQQFPFASTIRCARLIQPVDLTLLNRRLSLVLENFIHTDSMSYVPIYEWYSQLLNVSAQLYFIIHFIHTVLPTVCTAIVILRSKLIESLRINFANVRHSSRQTTERERENETQHTEK